MRVIREILGFEPDSTSRPPRAGAEGPRAKRATPLLGPETDLKGALEALVGVARRRSIAFVVSDFFAQGYERALALAAAKHDVVPVTSSIRVTSSCPTSGSRRSRTSRAARPSSSTRRDGRVRAHHAHEMKRIALARRALFAKLGLDAVEIETGGSFVTPLRDLFARRARRMRTR